MKTDDCLGLSRTKQDPFLKLLILPFRSFLDDLQSFAGFHKSRRELQRSLKHLLCPTLIALAGKNQAPVQIRLRVLGENPQRPPRKEPLLRHSFPAWHRGRPGYSWLRHIADQRESPFERRPRLPRLVPLARRS